MNNLFVNKVKMVVQKGTLASNHKSKRKSATTRTKGRQRNNCAYDIDLLTISAVVL